MAKKTKKQTREQQYGDVLENKGIRLDDCDVLAFVFPYPMSVELFHYALMAEKPEYYLFDGWESNAIVIAPKDEVNTEHITKIAEELRGKKTVPNLR